VRAPPAVGEDDSDGAVAQIAPTDGRARGDQPLVDAHGVAALLGEVDVGADGGLLGAGAVEQRADVAQGELAVVEQDAEGPAVDVGAERRAREPGQLRRCGGAAGLRQGQRELAFVASEGLGGALLPPRRDEAAQRGGAAADRGGGERGVFLGDGLRQGLAGWQHAAVALAQAGDERLPLDRLGPQRPPAGAAVDVGQALGREHRVWFIAQEAQPHRGLQVVADGPPIHAQRLLQTSTSAETARGELQEVGEELRAVGVGDRRDAVARAADLVAVGCLHGVSGESFREHSRSARRRRVLCERAEGG
jgi:hypothetical protein